MGTYINTPSSVLDPGILTDGDNGVAVALATGRRYSCAILDSDVKCWGAPPGSGANNVVYHPPQPSTSVQAEQR